MILGGGRFCTLVESNTRMFKQSMVHFPEFRWMIQGFDFSSFSQIYTGALPSGSERVRIAETR